MRFLLCFVMAFAGLSQQLSTQPPSTGLLNLPAQKIGANDLLSISVYGSPEFTRTVRVGADGVIRLPMVRTRLTAEGQFPSELETKIAEVLRTEQLVNDPFVSVNIAEYHSRPINVAGAVKTPLTFQAAGTVTLLEALTRAGGLTPDAGSEILVTRSGGGGDPLVRRVPVKGLIEMADPQWNLKLRGGEEIRVPEAGKVFVVGNVKRPGAYAVDGTETTVLKVLALAEGLSPFASKQAFIYRREANSSKNEIGVALKAILERKSPDAILQPNDILYIPDNSGRRLGLAALEKALLFGSTAGATALIYGR